MGDTLNVVVAPFFLPVSPRTKGNSPIAFSRGGRASLRPAKGQETHELTIKCKAVRFAPTAPFRGDLKLDLCTILPIPPCTLEHPPTWQQRARLGLEHPGEGEGDRGNFLKMVEDALEGLFYADDARIQGGDVSKRYGDTPGYWVRIRRAEGDVAPWRSYHRAGATG